MKTIHKYQCEICGAVYDTPDKATKCESIPVQHDRGVKVGDVVLITSGDGVGKRMRVTRIGVHEPGWGPARYDHSVFLMGDVLESWGSRQVAYNAYEVLP